MLELHLTQPGFTYSTCGSFMKHLESIQKFKDTSDLKYIYKNELDKHVLLMMLRMLILKILLKELFQIKIEHIKLQ